MFSLPIIHSINNSEPLSTPMKHIFIQIFTISDHFNICFLVQNIVFAALTAKCAFFFF